MYCPLCLIEVLKSDTYCPVCKSPRHAFEPLNSGWELQQLRNAAGRGVEGTPTNNEDVSREGGFRVSTVSFKSANFPIVTSNYIPGKEILEVVGIVFSSANRKMGLTTTNVASNAFKDAFQDIEVKARQLGATALISLTVSIERAGPSAIAFSQTVTLLGTAVKIK